MSDPKKPTESDKKLPKLDDNSVEEIPGNDLDDVAGGFTDCNCTNACTGSSVKASKAVQ